MEDSNSLPQDSHQKYGEVQVGNQTLNTTTILYDGEMDVMILDETTMYSAYPISNDGQPHQIRSIVSDSDEARKYSQKVLVFGVKMKSVIETGELSSNG